MPPPDDLAHLAPAEKRALLAKLLAERSSKQRRAPLSFAQTRLWFLDQLAPGNAFYNQCLAVHLGPAVDAEMLRRALNRVVARHEALRTRFESRDGVPSQVIEPSLEVPLPVRDLSAVAPGEVLRRAEQIARDEASRPFDITRLPLIRPLLLRLGTRGDALVLTLHHIVSDGWSLSLLFRELVECCTAEARGRPPELPVLHQQYADYAERQRRTLTDSALSPLLAYWRSTLQHLPTLDLPTDRPRPAVQTFRGAQHVVELPANLVSELRALARRENCTMFMVLLAGLTALLSRWSGQQDIAVGVPVAGRDRLETENLIGFFINSLVLRTQVTEGTAFDGLLRQVREMALGAFSHQELPFERLVEELHPERDLSRNPLFQISFQLFTAADLAPRAAAGEQLAQPLSVQRGTATIDLGFDFFDLGSTVSGVIEFATDLFDKDTVVRLALYWQRLLEEAAADPARPIEKLNLLTAEERQHLTQRGASAGTSLPTERLEALLARSADEHAERPALIDGETIWTYAELDRRAKAIAAALRARGVRRGDVVALALDRSLDWVAAAFGTLYAGAAFLPLDCAAPAPHLTRQLAQVRPAAAVIAGSHPTWVDLPIVDAAAIPGGLAPEIAPLTDAPADTAWVVFTSGSTGTPRPVAVGHDAAANHMQAMQSAMPLRPTDRVLFKYAPFFDAAFAEVFPAVLAGATIVLVPPGRQMDARFLVDEIARTGVTALDCVPALLRALLEEPAFGSSLPLRRIVSGGEALPGELADRILKRLPGVELWNAYGPTEACITATLHRCRAEETDRVVPIGRPIANMRALVLERGGEPAPVGWTGRLLLNGVGLAQGYRGDPALTARRFLHGMPGDRTERWYDTGDLAGWRKDGTLEFRGRVDRQAKIRGVRIEPAEVESVLATQAGVRDCAVVARRNSDGSEQLVAYVVPDKATPELWPSVGEYGLYDPLLYRAMTQDQRRNRAYSAAIGRAVVGRLVLDVGTGADAILARLCIEAGARHVYAIEINEVAAAAARSVVAREGLADRITVILGDAARTALPEKVDVIVSELIGMIGSSEGAPAILNAVRHHLKSSGRMIPLRCVTCMAAVELPTAVMQDPAFTELSGPYVGRIFERVGRPFDVRVCLSNISRQGLLSAPQPFEELDFRNVVPTSGSAEISLPINRPGRLDGFALWLNLWTDEAELIDSFDGDYHWLPVIAPVFHPGVAASEGDVLRATVRITPDAQGVMPDYFVAGRLERRTAPAIPFEWRSPRHGTAFRSDSFYRRLFRDGWDRRFHPPTVTLDAGRLRRALQAELPFWMVPGAFVEIRSVPRAPSGKLDVARLPNPALGRARPKGLTAPRTDTERRVAGIWRELLELQTVGIDDNFFDAGGHSLLVLRLRARLEAAFGTSVDVIELFRHTTIAAQAKWVDGGANASTISKGAVS